MKRYYPPKGKIRVLSRAEAAPLFAAKRLTPVGLYEPMHGTSDEYVFVRLSKALVRFYRLRPPVPL